jgi:hypothetical protein
MWRSPTACAPETPGLPMPRLCCHKYTTLYLLDSSSDPTHSSLQHLQCPGTPGLCSLLSADISRNSVPKFYTRLPLVPHPSIQAL